MRPFLRACPRCGAGKNDNLPNSGKKEIKIILIRPQKDVKDQTRKGCFGITIKCTKCGYKRGPYYQKKNNGRFEPVEVLRQRVANNWNATITPENSDKIVIDDKIIRTKKSPD